MHAPHGKRSRYNAGCRCLQCRAANSRYEVERSARRRSGEWNGVVPAERARLHIEELSDRGVGFKSVAAAAGVATSIVGAIKYGQRRQIRAETERRLLAVDEGAAPASRLIPSGPTMRRIQQLLDLGYTKRQLAAWMAYKNRAVQFGKTATITLKNAVRVERLCRKIELGLLQRD